MAAHRRCRLTEDQARRLRDRWVVRRSAQPCQHFQLELLWTEKGVSTDIYVCLHCGAEVCHGIGSDVPTAT
jgi:hypothetical protein